MGKCKEISVLIREIQNNNIEIPPFTIGQQELENMTVYTISMALGRQTFSLKLKKISCGTYTQWSITQPLTRIHLNQF